MVYLCIYFCCYKLCALFRSLNLGSTWEINSCMQRGCPPHIPMVTRTEGSCSLCNTFSGLSDFAAKSCSAFQRLRALHFQLTLIWFANCLHVRKGERVISCHCNLKSHNYGLSSSTGSCKLWQAPRGGV